MKRTIFISIACAFLTVPAMADLVRFVDGHGPTGYDGVDGFVAPATYQGTPWSTDDTTVTLGQSYSRLGGNATVSGHEDAGLANLSHRLTRGLGVNTGTPEPEEVDSVSGLEHIDIDFALAHTVNYVEVRSLFIEGGATELALVDFRLGGSLVTTLPILAVQLLGSGDGTAAINPGIVADQLVFYTNDSVNDFAVAQLNVVPVPVPAAVLLGMLGLGCAGWRLRKSS